MTGGTLFSSLGFYYIGPIDGHDLNSLIPILKNARDSKHDGPILIHIKTKKEKVILLQKKQKIIIMEYLNLILKLVSNSKVQ